MQKAAPQFSQPLRQIALMLTVVGLAGLGGWVAFPRVSQVFWENPYLNTGIFAVFLIGVITCFSQVLTLIGSVNWIEDFVSRRPGHENVKPTRLLAPLAALLRERGNRVQISSTSSRSILDSVDSRMDEGRDITRYLVNLLIFLGLLGTFFGLATTVPAVVETIRSLVPQEGESGMVVFDRLMGGLESQLGGMGMAFSSSLLGLSGSLIVGLLELFTGHGQNRFYRELEEWLSTITRVGLSAGEHEGADGGAAAHIIDNMAAQMESLQNIFVQAEVSRAVVDERLGTLADAVNTLAKRIEAESEARGDAAVVLIELAKGQNRMLDVLENRMGAEGGSGGGIDAESRMRLRSIDVQLLKILEELAAGRSESMADLRADLAEMTGAIRSMARASRLNPPAGAPRAE